MKICWTSINIGSKTSTSAYRTVTIPRTSHGLTTNHLLLETIRRQREELNLLRSNGRIGDNVHRNLERELDLKEACWHSHHLCGNKSSTHSPNA
jgi:hypothetical protein